MIANWLSVTVTDSNEKSFKYGLHPKVNAGIAALQVADVPFLRGHRVRFSLQGGLRHSSRPPFLDEPVEYRSGIRMPLDDSLVELLTTDHPYDFRASEDLKSTVAAVLGVSVEQIKCIHARPSIEMALAS